MVEQERHRKGDGKRCCEEVAEGTTCLIFKSTRICGCFFFVFVFFAGLRRLAGIVNCGMIGDHHLGKWPW